MRRPSSGLTTLNLDSLVDIVSNSVGILILLTTFVALLTLTAAQDTTPETRKLEKATEKVVIPWSHYSQKSGLFFLLRKNQVLHLDRAEVYLKLQERLSGDVPPPTELALEGYDVTLTPISGHAHCLDFQPQPNAGQWWHEFQRGGGVLEQLLDQHRPAETYFFFWVDPDSFELFRDLRQSLWDVNFEVGWKPVRRDSPLRYCSGFGQFRSFQPQ